MEANRSKAPAHRVLMVEPVVKYTGCRPEPGVGCFNFPSFSSPGLSARARGEALSAKVVVVFSQQLYAATLKEGKVSLWLLYPFQSLCQRRAGEQSDGIS